MSMATNYNLLLTLCLLKPEKEVYYPTQDIKTFHSSVQTMYFSPRLCPEEDLPGDQVANFDSSQR